MATIPGLNPNQTHKYAAKVKNGNSDNKLNPAIGGIIEGVDLNNFIIEYENVLLKYENYTWNFSLYALDKEDFKLFWTQPNYEVQKYVIAQSAVTGKYNITSVQMKMAGPATPGMTSNYNFNTATLNMSENNSMSLYDELLSLSNKLRYHKFMDLPLILDLEFIGYRNGVPEIIPNINRKWSVRISSVQATASQTGSTMKYTMSLVPNRATLVDNVDWTLKEQYNCVGADFGGFCQDLEDKLNDMAEQQYGYLRYQLPELADGQFFTIRVAPGLDSMIINYDSKQGAETNKTKSGSQGSKNFSWKASTPISRIIDDVVDCCTVRQDDSTSVRQFVNIIPVKHYVGFDKYRNTNVYKMTFYIVRYHIGDVVHESDLQKENFNFEYFFENSQKYIDPRNNEPRINMKRYDYQFSGLNDEILNLDLKFDQQFFVATTRNPGPIQDTENRAGTHNAQLLTIEGVQYQNVQDAWQKTSDIRRTLQLGGVLTEAQQRTIAGVDKAAADSALTPENQIEQDSYNNFKVNVLSEYVEDYTAIYEENNSGSDGIGNRNGEIFTMPTEATNNQTTLSASLNDNSNTYEMDRRKIRDNYYNRPFLAKLDMKVMGDPFWLGWSDYSYLQYLEQIMEGKDIELNSEDFHFANYITTEAYLLLNLQPVVAINDDTGVLDINTPTTFNQTIYRVNTITHDFGENGSYTQQITAAINIRSLRRRDSAADPTEGSSNG